MRHTEMGKPFSKWELPHPVYRFDCDYLTDNSIPEITIGVIKSTRYFSRSEKRLFLFKLYKGRHIRPLWMGSRVARPQEDFRIIRDSIPAHILTTEKTEWAKGIPVFYSLGNLVFDQKHPDTCHSQFAMFRFTPAGKTVTAETIPVKIEQCCPCISIENKP